MPRLCSFGCRPSDVTMHGFPNPEKYPDRFKTWVNLVGGKLETTSDYEYFRKKKVCDIHFTDCDRNRFRRLNILAVPSLHLPCSPRVVSVDINSPSTSAVNTSHNEPTAPGIDEHNHFAPSTAKGHDTSQNSGPETTSPVSKRNENFIKLVLTEHNYSAASRQYINGSTNNKPIYKCRQMKVLQKNIKNLRSEICRLRKKRKTFESRLEGAQKISKSTAFEKVVQNMKKPSQLFVHMQLQASKKPKGRRFLLEEKILALSLYKKSPKAYTLLHKYFTLPSARALKNLLSQIKLTPGINKVIFKKIKEGIINRDREDRLCSLMFDEMSITPQINYNSHRDSLEGFACNKENKIADHVLVFMVKGLKRNFKQPIAYYFTNCLNRYELKPLIKSVIGHAQESGLIITNTVCDQSAVNVGAIRDLVNETKQIYLRNEKEWQCDFFYVNSKKIIPLYDAPHLIKGLRNNLMTKNMAYTFEKEKKIVKWEYFQNVYAADKSYGELRLLHKVTEEHINPEKINKMRVKSATQLFSHSLAVVTEHLCGRGDLSEEHRDLIPITQLIDNLFDTLNVSSLKIPNGKIYKGPVRASSPHHKLWRKAKRILKSVRFIEKVDCANNKVRFIEKSVPSVTNLIKTIEGMEELWKVLSIKYGFDAMLTRNFNQDPIENFFGNIRSYGARNNAPNSLSFEGAFKALLLNNFNTSHSRGANCEPDDNECLQNFDFFLKEKPISSDVPNHNEIIPLSEDIINQNLPNQNDAGYDAHHNAEDCEAGPSTRAAAATEGSEDAAPSGEAVLE
ncbi:unnamed protein product [Colias eurytheme]|nr:unnamed protein product [Colias eurytheme]